jgi:hypothetical protein
MAGFVYNPAESIRRDFEQTGSAMGNIFAQVIQQQKRDYDLAETTYANIEALKKDLNIYGQKSITSKANALLGNVGSAILANGKLDYSKLGEVRRAVSDIKDLKTGYDLASKEFDKWTQMGLSNKANLNSYEAYYKSMLSKMSDENLIKNPRDLQVALADNYDKNLNAKKMFDQAVLSFRPYEKGEFTIYDDKKNQIKVAGELLAGEKLDANGNVIYPTPSVRKNPDGTTTTVTIFDELRERLNAINPDLIPLMKKQAGVGAEIGSENDLLESYYSKIPRTKSALQVKSAAGIKKEEKEADILEFQADHLLEEFNLDKLKTLTAIQANRASTAKDLALAKKANGEGFAAKSLSDFGITQDGFNFGDEVTVPVKNPKGQTNYIKATKLKWSPDGKLMVEGVPGKTDAMTNVFVPTGGVQLYPADDNTLAAFKMAVGNMGKDKQANISTGYTLFNSLPRPKTTEELLSGFGANRAPKTAGDLMNYVGAPKQKAAPAPVSANKPIVSAGKNWTPVD